MTANSRSTGIRMDHPALRRRLLERGGPFRRGCWRAHPQHRGNPQRHRGRCGGGADRNVKVRDFAAARRCSCAGGPAGSTGQLFGFARHGATRRPSVRWRSCQAPPLSCLMQSLRDDGLLVACKAAGLDWETAAAILDCRYSTGSLGAAELARAKIHFTKTKIEDARRLLTFWKVRSTPTPSRVN